jgi:hypothetical protein
MTIEEELDKVYDEIDDLMMDEKYSEIDAIIEAIDVHSLNPTLVLAYVVLTRGAESKLKHRRAFIKKALDAGNLQYKYLKEKYNETRR